MRAEAELREIAIAMAKDLGEAYAHVKAAEAAVESAILRLSKEEAEALDLRTPLGAVLDRIRLNAMRAAFPLVAARVAITNAIERENTTPRPRLIMLSDREPVVNGVNGVIHVLPPSDHDHAHGLEP